MGLGQGRGGGVRQIKSEGGSDIGRRVTAEEGDAGGFAERPIDVNILLSAIKRQ